jgi:hypothetical protein
MIVASDFLNQNKKNHDINDPYFSGNHEIE